jgi:hypothetical protein
MKALKSGEKVPASGIYRVLHSLKHAMEQRELYFEGSRFSACETCPACMLYRWSLPLSLAVPVTAELAIAAC